MTCNRHLALLIGAFSLSSGCATTGRPQAPAGVAAAAGVASAAAAVTSAATATAVASAAEDEVRSTEAAFAQSMADRDFAAFVSHLSAVAVFFDGSQVQRGAAEVSAAWKPLFRDPKAPFAWAPDHVEVLASGDLALSTGPVIVNDKVVGRFNSIWRLEAPHTWRIVFDKGESVCANAG